MTGTYFWFEKKSYHLHGVIILCKLRWTIFRDTIIASNWNVAKDLERKKKTEQKAIFGECFSKSGEISSTKFG
jgi:hypothetical protein